MRRFHSSGNGTAIALILGTALAGFAAWELAKSPATAGRTVIGDRGAGGTATMALSRFD